MIQYIKKNIYISKEAKKRIFEFSIRNTKCHPFTTAIDSRDHQLSPSNISLAITKQLVNPYKFHNPINVFESLGTKALFTAAAAQLELVRVNEKDARSHSSTSGIHVERDFWDNAWKPREIKEGGGQR